ncbi:MAG: hypothetical protein ACK5XA_08660 [Tagaea sp.]
MIGDPVSIPTVIRDGHLVSMRLCMVNNWWCSCGIGPCQQPERVPTMPYRQDAPLTAESIREIVREEIGRALAARLFRNQ